MSNSVFPTLAGIAIDITKTPLWKTMKRESVSGREFRASFMVYPRYRYTLAFNMLRNSAAHAEFASLIGFFNSMKGGYDSFLFTDPEDCTVSAMSFGTGDGVTTQFQLKRTQGTFADPIYDLNGAPVISVDGIVTANYTLSSTGVVTFNAAPANNKSVTWNGSFYWRCSFEDDEMDFDRFLYQVWEVNKVSMKTVKP